MAKLRPSPLERRARWRRLAGALAFFVAALASPARAELAGHGAMVNSVAVSPDGKRVLTGSWDYTLKLWDLHRQK